MNKQILNKESLISLTWEYIDNQLSLVEERNLSLNWIIVYQFESSPKVKLLLNETIDIEFYKNVTRWIVKKTSDIKNILKTKHYIYWLSETPSVKDIRYIGRTNNPYRRLFEHSSLLFMDESKEKDKWLFDNLTNFEKEMYIIILDEIEDLELVEHSSITRESLVSILEGKYIYYLNKSLNLLNKQISIWERYLNWSISLAESFLITILKEENIQSSLNEEEDLYGSLVKLCIWIEFYKSKYKDNKDVYYENELLNCLGLSKKNQMKQKLREIIEVLWKFNSIYKGTKLYYYSVEKIIDTSCGNKIGWKIQPSLNSMNYSQIRIPTDLMNLEKSMKSLSKTRLVLSIILAIKRYKSSTIPFSRFVKELKLESSSEKQLTRNIRELLNHCKKQRWIFGWERLKNGSYKIW